MLPFLEVTHLPSSSTFYSAIVQPLGLRRISTEDEDLPSVTYGTSLAPVFQLRQIPVRRDYRVKPLQLALSAPSAEAADDSYEIAVRAAPDARGSNSRYHSQSHPASSGISATRTISGGGKTRISITDPDGNIMDIVYRPPADYSDYYGGSTVRRTQSTATEASRILGWNYDVVTSDLPSPAGSGSADNGHSRTASRRAYSGRTNDERFASLRRSVTADASVYGPTASPRQNSNGLSAGAVVGTLLSGASGAPGGGSTVTYSIVKKDHGRPPRHDLDAPPPFARRSTCPDYHQDRKGRSIEVERAVDRVRYRDEYPPAIDRRPPPEYIARYSQSGMSRSREVEDIYDDSRGRHPSSRSRASARYRSESDTNRRPLLLTETEHRSHVSPRSPRRQQIIQRSYTYESPERESYEPARSHRSSSTVRAAPPPVFRDSPQIVTHSRSGNRLTTTTIKVGGDAASPRTLSRSGTYISARGASHQTSGEGARHEEWEDDTDSIAPSDSISCVGSRRSGRAYN